MKRAFITGITGFAGSHLAELLLSKKFEVHGLCRWRSGTENIQSFKNKVHLIEADLLDPYSLGKVKIQKDPTRMRPSDLPVLRGDPTKFRRHTGWKLKIPFEKTLKDLLNYWRKRV